MKRLLTFLLVCVGLTGYGQVVINEVCPANADINYDSDFFNFSPWIELSNGGNTAVNLSGFFLSDNESEPTRWAIPDGFSVPAKGFLLIWCDGMNSGLHTNFSLDSEGEIIRLSNPAGQVVDQLIFPKQYTNISYGRVGDGSTQVSYLLTPTPLNTNTTDHASAQLEAPEVSIPSGRYSGSQNVVLSSTNTGSQIRFTTDGSEPNSSSTLFTASININQTTTLKAKTFRTGFIPSQTIAETYFISEHTFSLPVVSIATKPNYLWDNTIGIYADGTNGIPGNCQGNPVNWNQDWDRHATVQLFDAAGKKLFDQAVDIRIGGGCSRNNPQKSIVLRARDKYGSNTMDRKFFSDKPHDRFGGLVMRNAGNDFNVSMFRDALMQTLAKEQFDIDYLAYQPTIFFLNGEYWGIQNMREKIDGDYIQTNYGIKKDNLDLLEMGGNPIEGDNTAYFNYLNTLTTLNPTAPETFEFIDQNIDVQEYINYLVTEIYFGNTDWPGNNIKYWRARNNGKFRWILWDMDFGFALYNFYDHPTLNFATDPDSGVGWPNPPWSTLHIRLALANPQFKIMFIQTLATAMGNTFNPQYVNQRITDFENRIRNEVPFHKERWGGNPGDWNFEIERLRNFATARYAYMQQHAATFFGLSNSVTLSAQSLPDGTGNIELNGVLIKEPMQNTPYFQNIPFRAEAKPLPGYKFKQWKITQADLVATQAIPSGAAWKYFDQGSLPATNWNSSAYSDNTWSSGPAQLGYGDSDEQTTVGYGPDAFNKYITTYFRKTITLSNVAQITGVQASALFDDGIVVYVNGTEVYRNNMPGGVIDNSTLAITAIPTENVFVDFSIPSNVLQEGTNVIAVEVHQNSGLSSDISFDLKLSTLVQGNPTITFVSDPLLTGTANGDVWIEAHYENANPISGLIINEVSAARTNATDEFGETEDWIELYNNSVAPIGLDNLFITDNLQTKLKHVFPAGSGAINPGEYKLIWADNQTGQSKLHTNFRLSADGEQVGLYQMVGGNLNTLDEVTFTNHNENVTASRIPNLTGPIVLTALPTPAAENIFETVTGVDEETRFQFYPNPVTDLLTVEVFEPVQIRLVNMQGAIVLSIAAEESKQLSLAHLPTGLYVLRISTSTKVITNRLVKQ
jgi:hypothetical protein